MLESVIEGYPKDCSSLYLGSGILKVLSRVIPKTVRVFTSVVVFGQVSFWLSKDCSSLYRNAQEGYQKTVRVFTSCRTSKHVRGLSKDCSSLYLVQNIQTRKRVIKRLFESLPRVNNYCLILFINKLIGGNKLNE